MYQCMSRVKLKLLKIINFAVQIMSNLTYFHTRYLVVRRVAETFTYAFSSFLVNSAWLIGVFACAAWFNNIRSSNTRSVCIATYVIHNSKMRCWGPLCVNRCFRRDINGPYSCQVNIRWVHLIWCHWKDHFSILSSDVIFINLLCVQITVSQW